MMQPWMTGAPVFMTGATLLPDQQGPLVPESLLRSLLERLDALTSLVHDLHGRAAAKPEIEPQARYPLAEAAAYLSTSTSTLKRRAARGKLVVLYDGKSPFVMGAELLRYAREGTRRRFARRKA